MPTALYRVLKLGPLEKDGESKPAVRFNGKKVREDWSTRVGKPLASIFNTESSFGCDTPLFTCTPPYLNHDFQMQVACYVRVSTVGQNEESQLTELRSFCSNHGWEPIFFVDKSTGTNLDRPALSAMEVELFKGTFDTVLVYKIDRLSRSLTDGINLLSQWLGRGIRFISASQRFDFSGAMGKMLASVLLSIGEMENEMRRERQSIGIQNAKAKGVYKGRASGSTKGAPARAKRLRAEGKRLTEIAAIMGISHSTAQRYLKTSTVQV